MFLVPVDGALAAEDAIGWHSTSQRPGITMGLNKQKAVGKGTYNMTISPKPAPEPRAADVTNEGPETLKPLNKSGDRGVVPKAGFEPAHPCGR